MSWIQPKLKRNTPKPEVAKVTSCVLPLRVLPKSLTQAAGLLKGRLKRTSLAHQKAFRKEW